MTKPLGATHWDGLDYWMRVADDEWYIWMDSCQQWKAVLSYQMFHDEFGIQKLSEEVK